MERPKLQKFKDVQVQVDFENEVVNETETKIDAPKTEEKFNCSLRITLENIPEKKLIEQLGIEEKIDEVVNEVAVEEEEVKKDEPKFEEKAKLYISSTINIWKMVLTKAIWADKKWAGFWQISLYIK